MILDNRYSLSSDRFNWIVTESYEGRDKDGNSKVQTREHFFSCLHSCVNWLLRNNCKDVDSLKEIVEELQKARDVCEAVLGGFNKEKSND